MKSASRLFKIISIVLLLLLALTISTQIMAGNAHAATTSSLGSTDTCSSPDSTDSGSDTNPCNPSDSTGVTDPNGGTLVAGPVPHIRQSTSAQDGVFLGCLADQSGISLVTNAATTISYLIKDPGQVAEMQQILKDLSYFSKNFSPTNTGNVGGMQATASSLWSNMRKLANEVGGDLSGALIEASDKFYTIANKLDGISGLAPNYVAKTMNSIPGLLKEASEVVFTKLFGAANVSKLLGGARVAGPVMSILIGIATIGDCMNKASQVQADGSTDSLSADALNCIDVTDASCDSGYSVDASDDSSTTIASSTDASSGSSDDGSSQQLPSHGTGG